MFAREVGDEVLVQEMGKAQCAVKSLAVAIATIMNILGKGQFHLQDQTLNCHRLKLWLKPHRKHAV